MSYKAFRLEVHTYFLAPGRESRYFGLRNSANIRIMYLFYVLTQKFQSRPRTGEKIFGGPFFSLWRHWNPLKKSLKPLKTATFSKIEIENITVFSASTTKKIQFFEKRDPKNPKYKKIKFCGNFPKTVKLLKKGTPKFFRANHKSF